MTKTVELHHAWTWDCPNCGLRNHTNGTFVRDLTAEEREQLGIEEDEPYEAATAPEEVTCAHCLYSFKTSN